jgi:nickel-type superoxide dismutase maturation protease
MLPLLQPGDELLVNCRTYKRSHPQVGDLVVLQHPDRANLQIIKRVVSVKKDGSCYVLGDNLVESTDSRAFGFVSPELILGKITSRFAGNRE